MVVDVTVVEAEFDVGRAGAVKLFVLERAGQISLPQAREVGQQPPPREAGHERKPEEHERVFGVEVEEEVDVVGGGVVVVVVEVSVGKGLLLVVGTGIGAGIIVVVVSVLIEGGGGVLEGIELVEIAEDVVVTTTTAVDTAIHPRSSHAYPGRQHPPPGFCGQSV